MKVAVMANGEWNVSWGQRELATQEIDVLICADGGGNHALAAGKFPDVLIGDLDSITEDSLKICQNHNTKIKKFPREKDETDLELALAYAETYLQGYGCQEDAIYLYAAAGRRLDHLLGNISLMLGFAEKNRRIKLVDSSFTAWVMLPGKELLKGIEGQQLSIISLSEQARVTSRGLYYELNNLTLFQNTTRGISNVFNEELAEIEVQEGKVLIILLNDNLNDNFK